MLIVMSSLTWPSFCDAQSVSASEREAVVRLSVERGGSAEDVEALIRLADEAAAKGLPPAPLTNKIREGLAKGHDPRRIELVVRQMAMHLEAADQLIREIEPATEATGREAAVTLLAESFGSGVTSDEVRDLRRQAQPSAKLPLTSEGIASAAKGLSFIKEARLPVADATAVMAEAARQGFRSHEMLAIGREVKRRESDYRDGRASLRALRDAIARGDRPDRLFRDRRADAASRPAERPATQTPDRPTRPDAARRPDQPERPTRPERTR